MVAEQDLPFLLCNMPFQAAIKVTSAAQ